MPPEAEFTEHYRSHYQQGAEEPLTVHGCSLPPLHTDDILTKDDLEFGLRSLNSNRSPGHDGCAQEYLKQGGSVLFNWMYVLLVRIWRFTADLPLID